MNDRQLAVYLGIIDEPNWPAVIAGLSATKRGVYERMAGLETEVVEKYHPWDGRALTPYEREILDILQEECAEVIVAISKLKRFGLGNTNPSTNRTNDRELGLEIGDLRYMAWLVQDKGLTAAGSVEEGVERKQRKLAIFLQNPETK